MKKNFIIILTLFLLNTVFGEEKSSIDVNLNFVSAYIWRGHDLLRNYALLQEKPYSSHPGPWVFQPSITWNTPVKGLYANLFASFALKGRGDKDIDKRIQTEPGAAFIASRTSLMDYAFDPSLDLESDILSSIPSSGLIWDYRATPNFYKEKLGLERNDELDITIGYEKDTKVGTIGFGIIHYKFSNVLNVGTLYGTEVFLTYKLPKIENLTFSVYEDIMIHTIYYSIGYSGSYELTKDINSSYSIGAGYYVLNNLQGVSDVTLNYTISHSSGFSLGLNVAITPERKIQEYYWGGGDPITSEVLNTKLPVSLNGQSSIYDGKVADPSRTLGPVNEYANSLISGIITNAIGIPYTYTPRQDLPKYYWWISLGYSITFE
ncbi:MAG: hypothetical protein ACK4UJ_09805 [Leptonema sp. (in: bacteria)]